ncbi:MAG TPA: type IV secretion system protein [Steroidobacteraceae bacterium]|jgi:type IV secretion system protein VirB6|nr:type IV secretion system protein [Steroidobacteraceae bacterium]
MGFFATFWSWLNAQLAAYIGDNTSRLAGVLEPTVLTLATIYVMSWGYLHLTGKITEPFVTGLKRVALIALILGVGLRLWLYNTLIVDTFYNAPVQLAAAMVGANDPVATIDAIWNSGGAVADNLWDKAVSWTDVGFYFAGGVVWCLMGVLCVYAMFLIALSSIALAVLLALGPLFFALLFFDATRRFFSAWIAQLANYALITVLTVMVAALLLRIVQSFAAQTAARGTAILTVDVLNMMLVALLVFLVLRQVMPIASGLAGGAALNSFGLTSRGFSWATRGAAALAKPAVGFSAPRVVRTLRDAARNTGRSVRGALGGNSRRGL